MTSTIICLFPLFFLVFSLKVEAGKPLKQFKGSTTSTQETEAYLEATIKGDNFCCGRQVKKGSAHEPRYNTEALAKKASYLKKLQMIPPPSIGKK